MKGLSDKNKAILICVLLASAVFAAYWRVLWCDFVNFDDPIYVTENEHIRTGFSPDNVKWALTVGKVSYWHPLTWFSHILDCQLYGLAPGLHHLTSLLIHSASSVLLFLLLRRMTGAVWRSAFVAALFALHPVNVDSVAWISQRKNVLSTFLWLLTLWAYTDYARRGGFWRYLISLLLFGAGLLAKPMLVTVPFVMLLLDYWPFERFGPGRFLAEEEKTVKSAAKTGGRAGPILLLVAEKMPFFALSAISVYLSSLSVQRLGITLSTELVPMKLRLSNALVSYVGYIGTMFVPRRLAVFYPYPRTIPLAQSIGVLALLVCMSVVFIWILRRRRYIAVGWLWYLGTLVPAVGLIQAGLWPAMADRWAYVPLIGLFVIVAWGVCDLTARWRRRELTLAFAAVICIAALMLGTSQQLRHWKNGFTLFTRALDVTDNNHIAHLNLGNAMLKEQRVDEAIGHYVKAIEIYPRYAEAHYNLGIALGMQKRYDMAINAYRLALQIMPEHTKARFQMANILTQTGQIDEAIVQYEKVVTQGPDDMEVLNNFSLALSKKGRLDEAIQYYYRCLEIAPDSVEVLNNLGIALGDKKQFKQATANFEKALSLNPDFAETYHNYAYVLKQMGELDKAAEYYAKVLELNPDDAEAYDGVGLVLAEKKDYDQAVESYEKAVHLNPDFATAYYHLGLAFVELDRIDEAVEQFRQVLRIHPNDAEMYCNVGILLVREGRLDEAIRQFRISLQLDPNFSKAARQLEAALAEKAASNSP